MNEEKKFPLSVAQTIAVTICKFLQIHCDKINIAGSIRRRKLEVKDIEIICLPKYETKIVEVSMFDEKTISEVNKDFQTIVSGLGTVIKGKPTGRYMQIMLTSGIKLDLFMPEANDYYRQYAIRTGSADYSHRVIATGWKQKGWVGSDQGLRRMKDCLETKHEDGKSTWKCIAKTPELPPVWTSEEDFFKWLHVKWILPQERI